MKVSNTLYIYGGAAALGLGLIWWATRAGNAAKLAQGTVRVAGELGTGVIKGVGEAVGIPDTSLTRCEQDLAAGKLWDASFSCPAGKFLGGVFGSTAVTSSEAADATVTDAQIDEYLQQAGQINYADYLP